MSISASFHDAVRATAYRVDSTEWLSISGLDGSRVSIFMPYQVAVDMAAVFNAQFEAPVNEAPE